MIFTTKNMYNVQCIACCDRSYALKEAKVFSKKIGLHEKSCTRKNWYTTAVIDRYKLI